MKKLLSLPPNLVECFHDVAGVSHKEYFCTSDPVGARLGSGGGTNWLLEACHQDEAPEMSFEEYYDLKVFLDISSKLQKERILKRNSLEFANRFFYEWIPLENLYFSKTNVKERCDLIIKID